MDLKKSLEFFNPTEITDEIHIIGLGAVGSHIAETMTRLGIESMHLYDFDTVSPHNIANQMFFDYQAEDGTYKTKAIQSTCQAINPDIKITLHEKGYNTGMRLSGYVFLAVDNIDLRRAIVEEHQYNPQIKAMFDFRMGLADAQHYAANWSKPDSIIAFHQSMEFSHEEAKESMPISACGTALNVIPTVRTIVSLGIANWMNFVREKKLKKIILIDAFKFTVDAFDQK
jgi:molybdopterin/thiamine biosynthesis adenylyltransferase